MVFPFSRYIIRQSTNNCVVSCCCFYSLILHLEKMQQNAFFVPAVKVTLATAISAQLGNIISRN